MKPLLYSSVLIILCSISVFSQGPGTALQFDGSNDYVNISTTNFPLGTNARTIEAWFKTTMSGLGIILAYGPASTGNMINFGVWGSSIFIDAYATPSYTLAANINDGSWHHLAFSYDGTNAYTYVDGNLLDARAFSINTLTGGGVIGAAAWHYEYFFNGTIDEVRMWNVARTQSEIRSSMHQGLPGSTTGLIGYWQFSEGSGTSTEDASSSANTGTLVNGPSWLSSTGPFGGGTNNTQIVNSTGSVAFTGAKFAANFTSKTGTDTLVVTSITDTLHGTQPTGVNYVFPHAWIVHRFGSGTFTTNVTFTFAPGSISAGDQATSSNLKLFSRGTTASGSWTNSASGTSATDSSVTFTGITSFSQLEIGSTSTYSPAAFSLSSNSLSFGNVNILSTKTDSVTVSNTGIGLLNISSVTSDDNDFAVSPGSASLGGGGSQKFYITFSPTSQGSKNVSIIFNHTATGSPDTVSVSGTGNGPEFALSQSSITFGNVDVATTKQDSVTITNGGNATLRIDSIRSTTNSDFNVFPPADSILSTFSKKVYITFNPASTGLKNGNIVLYHNAYGSPDTIAVDGNGYQLPQVPDFALQFDGTNDYINIGTTNFPLETNARTFETWVKTTMGGLGMILAYGHYPSYGSMFNIGVLGSSIFVDAYGSPQYTVAANINDGAWHHLAFSYDGTNAYTYVDGNLLDVRGFSINTITGDGVLGSAAWHTEYFFNGTLDEVRMWNVVRTKAQIRGAMHQRLPGSTSGLVGYWQFNETSGTIANDASSSGNTGTLINGSSWINSTGPFGTGSSNTQFISSTGNVAFTGTKVNANFKAKTGTDTLVVTGITDTLRGTHPTGVNYTFPYSWIIHRFGTGTFTTNLTFTLAPGAISTGDQSSPSNLKLFSRGTTASGSWTNTASGSSATDSSVTFTGISSFSQLEIGSASTYTAPSFGLSTASLSFGNVNIFASKVDSLTVSNTGMGLLNVWSSASDNSDFTVLPASASLGAGGSQKFYVTYSPTSSGNVTGNLIFIHNGGTSPDTVSLSGTGHGPEFALNQSVLSFGSVIVGANKQDSVLVTNNGDVTLRIDSIRSKSNEFSVLPLSDSILSSNSKSAYITFNPTSIGLKDGTIIFYHNAYGSPDTLIVHGNAYIPGYVGTQTSWQFVNPMPQGNPLRAVHVFDSLTVVAVGQVGTVIRTTNGGTTWRVQQYAGGAAYNLKAMSFGSKNVGIAVGSYKSMIKTTDGGISWRVLPRPNFWSDYSEFYGISMSDSLTATVVGSDGIMRSTDGGFSWSEQTYPSMSGPPSCVSFFDSNNGFIVGALGTIFHTTNGGALWTVQTSGTSSSLNSVAYLDSTTVVTVGVNGVILMTTNGGTTWTDQSTGTGPWMSVSFFGLDRGVIVGGGGGGALYSSDGGLSWTQVDRKGNYINSVMMIDENKAYAVGDGGVITYTSDGGISWTALSNGKNVPLWDVTFVNEDYGYAVGYGDNVLRTTNGGQTWDVMRDAGGIYLHGVSFTSITTGVAVGSGGWTLRTTNSGVSWAVIASGSSNDLYKVQFTSQLKGWAAGDGGTILTTTNGGLSWSTVTSGVNQNFYGMYFLSDSLGYVVSSEGTILKTTNAGSTWSTQTVSQNLTAVTFVDENIGYALGYFPGAIIKTTDGGTTWIDQTPSIPPIVPPELKSEYIPEQVSKVSAIPGLWAVSFIDAEIGTAVGEGIIVRTTNGGTNWSYERTPTQTRLTGLHAVHIGSQWIQFAVGGERQIIYSAVGPFNPKLWTGVVDSSWNTSNNWKPVGIPQPGDSVIIPSVAQYPVIDNNQQQLTIAALDIQSGGKLKIIGKLGRFVIAGDVTINGAFVIDSAAATEVVVGGSWLDFSNQLVLKTNSGDEGYIPGTSLNRFTTKGTITGNFYAVLFDTLSSYSTYGNVRVSNRCTLIGNLYLSESDTLSIFSDNPLALDGHGYVNGEGAITRYISPILNQVFRFESESTYVAFTSGTPPTSVTMVADSNAIISDCNEEWVAIPSSVDTVTNNVISDGIAGFSRWSIRVPRPSGQVSSVNRLYDIKISGGGIFGARLSLHYTQDEVDPGVSEDSLVLFRSEIVFGSASVAQRWNMISLPEKLYPYGIKSVLFPTANSQAFRYIPGSGYHPEDTLYNRIGYWLKFPSIKNIDIENNSRILDTINVAAGWNMIGTLSRFVSLANITSIPTGLISSSFYGYSNGYHAASTLDPLKGYWVKINSPGGKLILDAQCLNAEPKIETETYDNYHQLIIQNAVVDSMILLIAQDDGVIILSKHELPPSPPAGIFDARFSSGRNAEILSNTSKNEYPLQISSNDYPITMRWESINQSLSASLKIGDNEVSFGTQGLIEVTSPATEFILKINSGNEIPKEFALDQNYPNPFNPVTSIHYALPTDARVTLKVYNILGQLVKTLVDQVQTVGYKSVEFNASALASGVYYYRIEATSVQNTSNTFVQVKKMMVIK